MGRLLSMSGRYHPLHLHHPTAATLNQSPVISQSVFICMCCHEGVSLCRENMSDSPASQQAQVCCTLRPHLCIILTLLP